MLYGVSLGLCADHLTLRALEVIEGADEVIVPGEMAAKIVGAFREPRIVEFPMGRGREVAAKLAAELADRCVDEDIAFCCIGDATLYSTFSHLAEEVLRLNPGVEVEIVPGVSSVSTALAKLRIFIRSGLLVTTDPKETPDVVAVLKAKRAAELAETLKSSGFKVLIAERLFMEGEKLGGEIPELADYFSVLVGVRDEGVLRGLRSGER